MPKVWPHLEKKADTPPDGQDKPRLVSSRQVRQWSTVAALLVALGVALPYVTSERPAGNVSTAVVTDCDRLAAHPSDTQKLTPGVPQGEVDLPAARAACEAALAGHPDDGRTLYQLGRVNFYAENYQDGIGYFRRSAAAGYPQGQFILGLILVQGNTIEPDTCAGGALWAAAARQRHFYSKIYLGQNWIDGMFADCALDVTETEITQMIADAETLVESQRQRDELAALKAAWENR